VEKSSLNVLQRKVAKKKHLSSSRKLVTVAEKCSKQVVLGFIMAKKNTFLASLISCCCTLKSSCNDTLPHCSCNATAVALPLFPTILTEKNFLNGGWICQRSRCVLVGHTSNREGKLPIWFQAFGGQTTHVFAPSGLAPAPLLWWCISEMDWCPTWLLIRGIRPH
jgi:hypothetical protein